MSKNDSTRPGGAQGLRDWAPNNGISVSQAYKEIAAGRLKTFKVGKRRLVSDEAGAEWRRAREQESFPAGVEPTVAPAMAAKTGE